MEVEAARLPCGHLLFSPKNGLHTCADCERTFLFTRNPRLKIWESREVARRA